VSAVADTQLGYADFLHLDTLLSLQRESQEVLDAHFFFTVHQVFELQFKMLLYELDRAVYAIAADDLGRARYCLRRVRAIEDVTVAQLATLETISPGSFAALRRTLASSSGLQSVQYREIEFVSGRKDPDLLSRAGLTEAERGRLAHRLAAPSLWDEFCALLRRRGDPDLLAEYRTEVPCGELAQLAEALVDHDEGMILWRTRHLAMVERIIGGQAGTGGSTGVGYLRAGADTKFFPSLWQLRGAL